MRYIVFTIMTLALFHVASADGATATNVRFRKVQNSYIAIPVLIDGRGPYEFLLDTGTETSLIDTALARELNLSPLDRLTLETATGQKSLSRDILPLVSVGIASRTNLEVLEDHLKSISDLDPRLRGILGQNFLRQFNYQLDYKHRHVTFFKEGVDERFLRSARIPFLLVHGRPVLIAKTNAGEELRLLLDSGASAVAIFKTGLSEFHTCSSVLCEGTMTTLVAPSDVHRGTLSALSLGAECLHNVDAYLMFQRPEHDPIDGMLPTSLFATVYIDNREGYAIVNCGTCKMDGLAQNTSPGAVVRQQH